jgi:hypothetical protein
LCRHGDSRNDFTSGSPAKNKPPENGITAGEDGANDLSAAFFPFAKRENSTATQALSVSAASMAAALSTANTRLFILLSLLFVRNALEHKRIWKTRARMHVRLTGSNTANPSISAFFNNIEQRPLRAMTFMASVPTVTPTCFIAQNARAPVIATPKATSREIFSFIDHST